MNTLLKIFFYWLAAITILIIVYSLLGPSTKKIDLKKVSFNTSSSSEIYFKNLRSFYYSKVEDSASSFNIYTLKKLEEQDLPFELSIVHNWMQSEAYIFFDFDTSISTNDYQIFMESESAIDSIILKDLSSYSQYVFAAQLFECLTSDKEFYFFKLGNNLSEMEKKTLKICLRDYFKLVGKIN